MHWDYTLQRKAEQQMSRSWYWCWWGGVCRIWETLDLISHRLSWTQYLGRGPGSAGYYEQIDEDPMVGHFIFMLVMMISIDDNIKSDHIPCPHHLHQSAEVSSSRTNNPIWGGVPWNWSELFLCIWSVKLFPAKTENIFLSSTLRPHRVLPTLDEIEVGPINFKNVNCKFPIECSSFPWLAVSVSGW